MDFIIFEKERYSVRKFTEEPIQKEALEKILQAGHVAPTGCNYQPQKILVLNMSEALERLRGCTKCHFNAPTVLVICFDKTECWVRKYDGAQSGQIDATIVATYMMLEASSIGVGSTMVMHFNPQALREAFDIPKEYEPVLLLPMGYPAEDSKPLGLHYETRPVSETVFYEKFNEKI